MKLPDTLTIPQSTPVLGKIRIPGSKSLSNRAILIASLAKGESSLQGVLHSDDTQYMLNVCNVLGARYHEKGNSLQIWGCDGMLKPYRHELFIGNAGTAARFLTAILPLGSGNYTLNGNERMQQRPILDLIQSLNTLGANVIDLHATGCPPVKIIASGLNGGEIVIPGDKSSQYVSAIMLSAPYAKNKTTIHISGDLVSRTYVEMTRRIMEEFNAVCRWVENSTLEILPGHRYQSRPYEIEGDASSASYFFGMAAVTKGEITISGLSRSSSQGDLGFVNILEQMGCDVRWNQNEVTLKGRDLKAVEVDMNTMSDVAPTLAVVALFADGVTHIRNVGNMRIKECDRISAMAKELQKLGAVVNEWDDGLSIQGGDRLKGAKLETYDDHRIAMSLSLAGLKIPDVEICNPSCVSKTFPHFYDMFLPLIQG